MYGASGTRILVLPICTTTLTTSEGSRTWPVGLQLMVGEFQLPWGPLSAGGIISILPILALFAIVQRTMVRGIAAGAVKG